MTTHSAKDYQEAIANFQDVTLEDGNLVVELEYIGEGEDGDYNPNDPRDVPLLRFSVSMKDESGEDDYLEDSSYCTQLPVTIDEPTKQAALARIMADVKDAMDSGRSLKRTCEALSWLSPADLSGSGPRP